MGRANPSENQRPPAPTRGDGWSLLRALSTGPFRVTVKHYESSFRQGPHAHDRGTIDFTLAGGGIGTCGGHEVVSRPGQVEYFSPGRNHDFACGPRGIRTLHVTFPPEALDPPRRSQAARDDILGIDPAAASGLAARLAGELADADASSPLACEGLAHELLAATTRWRDRPEPGARWLTWTREHLHAGGDCSLAALATEAGVHPAHLARSFSAQYGVSPGEYHRRVRLAGVASRLAAGPASLARLAVESGFADQAHLTRWFKRTLGLTPGAYARVMHPHAGAPRP